MILFIFFPLVRSLSFSLFSLFMNLIRALILLLLCCYVVMLLLSLALQLAFKILLLDFDFIQKKKEKKSVPPLVRLFCTQKKRNNRKEKAKNFSNLFVIRIYEGWFCLHTGTFDAKVQWKHKTVTSTKRKQKNLLFQTIKIFCCLFICFHSNFLLRFHFRHTIKTQTKNKMRTTNKPKSTTNHVRKMPTKLYVIWNLFATFDVLDI